MTIESISVEQTNGMTRTKRVTYVFAIGLVLLSIFTLGLRGAFRWSDEERNMLTLAIWFAGATPIVAMIFWLIQGRPSSKFRAPTGREITTDLLIALWGVPFVIPLLLVTLDGELMPGIDPWLSAGVAVVGILFPAIRPRKNVSRTECR